MYRALHADENAMTGQRQDRVAPLHTELESEEGVVAASATRILAKADRTVDELRAEAERAAEDLRGDLEAELSEDRATIAEVRSDLARVHAQLDQINSGIIGLQNHSLRLTGVAVLALAVVVTVAWKVMAG
jgi:chromosome segregation ATPase